MKEILIDQNGAGKRLDKFIIRYLSGAPKSLLFAQMRKKNITLNDRQTEGSEILSEGDRIQCFFSDETWEKFVHPGILSAEGAETFLDECRRCYADHPGIPILYEDPDVLIADKPAGLLTQRAKPQDESLNDWLIGYLLSQEAVDAASLALFRPSACHRLDRNTGGIVLCAKSLAAAQQITAMIRERRIGKYYLAVLHGNMKKAQRIRSLHDKEEEHNLVTLRDLRIQTEEELTGGADRVSPKGAAETAVAPLRYDAKTDTTLVLAKLFTGKTHQLRAQFAATGHPIVGDPKYGGWHADTDKKNYGTDGQLLHASYLIFPENREELKWLKANAFFSDPFTGPEDKGSAWTAFSSFAPVKDEDLIKTIRSHREVYAE